MISVKKKIGTPQYRQIISSIEHAIVNGELKRGDKLPSINLIKNDNKLSRDTVLAALNDLKNRGIINSIVGKGYYVTSEDVNVKQKIFLLFDELNSFKEDLYYSFLENLESHIQVDIFFHHFNKDIFLKLIQDNVGEYSRYVIMPANLKEANFAINLLPKDKVYILDQMHDDLKAFSSIHQNFEEAIYLNLKKVNEKLQNYNILKLVFFEEKQPLGLVKGFKKYCHESGANFEVIRKVDDQPLKTRELYIIPDEKDLLRIIKKMKEQNLKVVEDIGLISYNDNLLKEILEGGITTISTDFKEMGKRLAEIISSNEIIQIENPHKLIIRNSI